MKTVKKIVLSALIIYATLASSAKAYTSKSSQAYLEKLLFGSSQQQIENTPSPFQKELKEYMHNSTQEQIESAQKILPYHPKTLEDHIKFYDRKLTEEGERNNLLLRNFKAQNTIWKYYPNYTTGLQTLLGTPHPVDEERKIVRRATEKMVKRAFSEMCEDSPDIEEAKREALGFLYGFYVSAKGSMANGLTGIATLDEVRRLKNIKRKDKLELWGDTINELGRRYRADLGGEFNYDLGNLKELSLTKIIQGIETEISIRDFKLLGQRIHELEIKAKSDQELRANLIKVLGPEWYLELSIRYGCFPGHLKDASAALIQEKPNSRLSISTKYSEEEIDRFLTVINFIHRF
jgi:hypothetical protein